MQIRPPSRHRLTNETAPRRASRRLRRPSLAGSRARLLCFSIRCILLSARKGPRFASLTTTMVIHDSGGNHPEKPRESFISRYLFSTDHKTIGLQYLWLALLSVFVGMAMSLVMRIHLAWPEMHIPFLSALGSSPERKEKRSEEHTSELQSRLHLVCRLL